MPLPYLQEGRKHEKMKDLAGKLGKLVFPDVEQKKKIGRAHV